MNYVKKQQRCMHWLLMLGCLLGLAACDQGDNSSERISLRSFEEQVGTRFFPVKSADFKAPTVEEIPLDFPADANAIWGAIGRDDQGRIYIGASTHAGDNKTAYLAQYNPRSGSITYQGDVVEQLKRLGLHSPGMGQNKLHSKFYLADDGYIYFSSFDGQGESTNRNPTWGGHLWRKLPDSPNWEHVLAAKEALIAVNLSGQYVYTLGYWGHVLYQYNIYTDEIATVTVGSVANHISRNFLVDPRGHAYVPHVERDNENNLSAVLHEYDTELALVGAYPLPSYTAEKISKHHGIIGYTSMKNGDIVFTTSDGGLYYLNVFSNDENKLDYKGMMHPDGKAYIASVFPMDGVNFIAGAARGTGKGDHDWIVYDLNSQLGVTHPLTYPEQSRPLSYGTLTKDDSGNSYLVGRGKKTDLSKALLLVRLKQDGT